MSSNASAARSYVLASRGSALARVQTESVMAALQDLYPESGDAAPKFSMSFIQSGGDVNQSTALYILGGKSLWTKELEVALKENACDFLVHAFKDVPTVLPDGCMIGAVMKREDPVDVLVVKKSKEGAWKTLEDLPPGSTVGTGSIRRIAQLKRRYPDLRFQDCRGNIDTRLAKCDAEDGPYAAIILGRAGLARLGLADRVTLELGPPIMYHAVSQGAIGIEIRTDDIEALRLCEAITDKPTHIRCFAERALLRVLEGGCSVPVGVASSYIDNTLEITGCVTSLDGETHIEHTLKEDVVDFEGAEKIGTALAKKLVELGAKQILDDIEAEKQSRAAAAKELGSIP